MPEPDEHLARLGAVIRSARLDRGMTQEELAFAAGLQPAHVSAIERGLKDVQARTIFRLCSAMGMTPGELFALYDERVEG